MKVTDAYDVSLAAVGSRKIVWSGCGQTGRITLVEGGRVIRGTGWRSPEGCARFLNHVTGCPLFESLIRVNEEEIEAFLQHKNRKYILTPG
jgi:hypothetical protein